MPHKAVRAALSVTAAAATGFHVKNLYDAHNFYEPVANNPSFIVFGKQTQDALRDMYKDAYTSKKPLSFGVSSRARDNASAKHHNGVNYVLFGYNLLPFLHTPFTRPPKPLENESEDAFKERYAAYYRIKKQEDEAHKEILYNPPLEDFKELLNSSLSFTTKHEIGHLVHEHSQKHKDDWIALTTKSALLSTLLNGYITKSGFAKNSTTIGLLSKIGAIGFSVAGASIYSLYEQNKKQRLREQEADDFALQHAVSKYELIQEQIFLEKHLKEEAQAKKTIRGYLYCAYFATHPSLSSRIEKIQKVIDAWEK